MLPFIPRKVAQRSKGPSLPNPPVGTNPSPAVADTRPGISTLTGGPSRSEVKGKAKHADPPRDEDLATLVMLSMSEHTLWSDPDLRRTLEASEEGYIPLTYLLLNSPYLSTLDPPPSEVDLLKAIRSRLAEAFDVRVLISSPSRSNWHGKAGTSKDTSGGYEVRLKGQEQLLQRARNMSRNDWESRILYMENIPFQYRSIPSISRFTSSLLGDSSSDVVQCITLPKHHQDQPGDQPKCKGFALVTLSSLTQLETLLTRWPWARVPDATKASEEESGIFREARKVGFRTISKSQWNKLNEEYLAYRQSLLDEMKDGDGEYHDVQEDVDLRKRPASPSEPESLQEETLSRTVTTLSSPYPLNCLLFVRNVHPETNKTTLKTLFSSCLSTSNAEGELSLEGIDYVDFNKGMDSCYLRVATPDHARALVHHFSSTAIAQAGGLDSTGAKTGSDSGKPIKVELVEGTREELYWAKVPEKVRRAAAEKAVRGVDASRKPGNVEGKGKRKRRRK